MIEMTVDPRFSHQKKEPEQVCRWRKSDDIRRMLDALLHKEGKKVGAPEARKRPTSLARTPTFSLVAITHSMFDGLYHS